MVEVVEVVVCCKGLGRGRHLRNSVICEWTNEEINDSIDK